MAFIDLETALAYLNQQIWLAKRLHDNIVTCLASARNLQYQSVAI